MMKTRFATVFLTAFVCLRSFGQTDGWTGNTTLTTTPATVVIGTPGTPQNKLHVFTAANGDGVAVDGSSNPGLNFKNSGTVGAYLVLATAPQRYFATAP